MLIINSQHGRDHIAADDARALIAQLPTPPARWALAEQVEALRDEQDGSSSRPTVRGTQRRPVCGKGSVPPRVIERGELLLAALPPADAPRGLSRAELSERLGWSEWMTSEVLAHMTLARRILRHRSGSPAEIGCVTYRRPAEVCQ